MKRNNKYSTEIWNDYKYTVIKHKLCTATFIYIDYTA